MGVRFDSLVDRWYPRKAACWVALLLAVQPFLDRTVLAQPPQLSRRTPDSEVARSKLEKRITLDIEVTDATGAPVRGLNAQNFQLLDDGHVTQPTSFAEVDSGSAQPATEAILLVDAINATFEDVGLMRQGIETFLRQNHGQLPLPVSIVFLTDQGMQLNKSSRDGLELLKDFSKLQTPVRMLGSAQATSDPADRWRRSLHFLDMLSQYEASRPGRKLLLWLGPGWPLLSEPGTAPINLQNAKRFYKTIVDTTTELRRAHITLYSVAPLNLAHDSTQSPLLYQAFLKGVSDATQADSANLAAQVLATHSGGLVLNRYGDLPAQIHRCLQDASSFYEVTLDAAPGDPLGVFHSIAVTVDRPGLTARTNTAYYAGPPQFTADSATLEMAAGHPAQPNTLQTQARLVVLDVTALDSNGSPVAGLGIDDFKLRDNKRPQKVSSLEVHSGYGQGNELARQNSSVVEPASGDSRAVTNRPANNRVWNVLAIDLINTSRDDRGRLEQQLAAFANQLPVHTPVALVTMAGGIRVLSSFVDGPAGVAKALKRGLGPLQVGIPANIVERNELQESVNVTDPASLQNKANVDMERQGERTQMTLNDLASMAAWLRTFPGKKNVFWLSSGFPLEGQPFGTIGSEDLLPTGPGTAAAEKFPMQSRTDKELELARVSVYPIDVRGVAVGDVAGETSADSGGNFLLIGKHGNPTINVVRDNDLKAAEQSEMLEIAHATGGVAQFNNDLTTTLLQALSQAESYYTLSYTPQEAEWDGKYHRFRLAVDKPGIRLVYRQGYYARDAQAEPSPTTADFKAALEPEAPSATSVLFTAHVDPKGETADVQYAITSSTVQFLQAEDGRFAAELDCAVLEFNAKGKLLEKSLIRLSDKTALGAPPPRTPLSAQQSIRLKPEAATLMIGVRDRSTGLFGTVQASVASR